MYTLGRVPLRSPQDPRQLLELQPLHLYPRQETGRRAVYLLCLSSKLALYFCDYCSYKGGWEICLLDVHAATPTVSTNTDLNWTYQLLNIQHGAR